MGSQQKGKRHMEHLRQVLGEYFENEIFDFDEIRIEILQKIEAEK